MKKKDIQEKCKALLNAGRVGTIFTPDSLDYNFLISVLRMHERWDEKQGAGIAHVTTQRTKYGNRCFVIVRTDGTSTDISYTSCLKGKRTDLHYVKMACRTAIRDIVTAFRKSNVQYGHTCCPITGEVLTPSNTHIDHYDQTFQQMFDRWMIGKNPADLVKLMNDFRADGNYDYFFEDQAITQDFITFHNANTNLRAVSKTANLSHLKIK